MSFEQKNRKKNKVPGKVHLFLYILIVLSFNIILTFKINLKNIYIDQTNNTQQQTKNIFIGNKIDQIKTFFK